jgi:hypothetical protein
MLRKVPTLSLLAGFLMLGLVLLPKAAVAGVPEDELPEGYYFCHHLGNDGYNSPNASSAGVVFGHYGDSHQDGLDIIPPFTFEGVEYSQNWDATGIAIHDNGCVVPDEPTEVPPTEVPPTEVPPTEVPPTEVPPTEVPPTDVPPTDPAQPTATSAPNEPTKAPAEPTPTIQVSVLPVTGAEPGGTDGTGILLLAALSTLLLVAGASTVMRSRRSR